VTIRHLEVVLDNPLYGQTKQAPKVDLNWLYRKYRGICWICRKFCPRDQASRDHITPKSLGGGSEKENIALAHKVCNSKRGNGYREIYFRHYENMDHEKDIVVLEDHGLIVQVWHDIRNGGYNVLVAKKFKNV
jgi:hypothetical protein